MIISDCFRNAFDIILNTFSSSLMQLAQKYFIGFLHGNLGITLRMYLGTTQLEVNRNYPVVVNILLYSRQVK